MFSSWNTKVFEMLEKGELEQWFRTGRGHRFDFFATDEEIQEWLQAALPAVYRPYTLIGVDRIKQTRFRYGAKSFECPVSQFLQCRIAEVGVRRSHYWVRSQKLTPKLPLQVDLGIDHVYSFSGLVSLQHGSMIRVGNPRVPAVPLYQAASSISVVPQVQNRQTGEIRDYPEYLKIFESLRRRIRQDLVYTTITRFADGSEREDRLLRMTQGAKELFDQGHPFINRPGEHIEKKRK
jgi:hypothetical protein